MSRSWFGLTTIAAAIVGACVLYFALCDFVVSSSLEPIRNPPDQTPADAGFVAEDVRFESADDRIPLVGWLIAAAPDRAVVLLHGLGCNSWTGAQQDIAAEYVAANFTVLVFDFRGHGRSGGERLGLGWDERRDVRAAVDLLLGRGFKAGRIGVYGVSYGAATALLAAASIPEIGAVVADSAFADARDVMAAEIQRKIGVPPWVVEIR